LESKTCITCHIEKSISDFHRNASRKDGYRRECAKCRNQIRRKKHKDTYSYKVERGMVYCMESEGFYKIGVTRYGIRKRLQSIQTGNPFEVKLLWAKRTNNMGKYERTIHQQLKNSHVRGEWYAIPRVLALELKNIVTHDDV
jgi:hypothetical protein